MYSNIKKIKYSITSHVNKGLTLIELMVVISIFMIITSIAIFNYGNFSSTVSLQNLTDDIALSIRKAQSFAIGARAIEGVFTNSYGMHFSMNKNLDTSTSGSDKSFLMFSSSDKEYKNLNPGVCGPTSGECIELFNIDSVNGIESIKAYDAAGVPLSNTNTSSVDIVFIRPDPKASFCYKETSASVCDVNISKVDIVITNNQDAPQKRIKTISIQNTGQISIQ